MLGIVLYESGPCACTDPVPALLFSEIVSAETKLDVALPQLWAKHRGWMWPMFAERENADLVSGMIRDMGLGKTAGVYILWMLKDYCDAHGNEIYEAIYVGKAGSAVQRRLLVHQTKERLMGDELTAHVTVWETTNRLAKYMEQVLLDVFWFEGNATENAGIRPLRAAVVAGEWD